MKYLLIIPNQTQYFEGTEDEARKIVLKEMGDSTEVTTRIIKCQHPDDMKLADVIYQKIINNKN